MAAERRREKFGVFSSFCRNNFVAPDTFWPYIEILQSATLDNVSSMNVAHVCAGRACHRPLTSPVSPSLVSRAANLLEVEVGLKSEGEACDRLLL